MGQSTVRALFLDAGNTLFTERRPRASIYATVARKFGGRVDDEETASAMASTFAELPSSVAGNFRFSIAWFHAFNLRVMESLGVSAKRREAAHLELVKRFETPRTYRLFDEVPAVLDHFLNAGIVLGVVSNWSERLPTLLAGLGIAEKLDFIVTSAEMKAEKPDRAIFERALFRAGVPAGEALHVGDHMDRDVRGALGAGLRAALLDRSAAPGSSNDGVPVLSDLRELLPLVEQQPHASSSS